MGRGLKWIIALLVILLAGVGIYKGYQWRTRGKRDPKDQMYVVLKPIHTEMGWGYDIWVDKGRFMHQPFIPAIPGRHGFKTKEDALAVGKIVYDRIIAGQMPMVSVEEIKDMGLLPDSTTGPQDPVQPALNASSQK
jgi:uncharacterized protein DUF4907